MTQNFSAGEALFVGDWESLGMVHLEVPKQILQRHIPFELDTFAHKAFVSLVFFTMRRMRLARGARILDWLFYPFREQRFLNVRTYVRHEGEPGIHFITEWISDPVCAHLGPLLYALPYRHGRHEFLNSEQTFTARVTDCATETRLHCDFEFRGALGPCDPGSRDGFFFERYVAFNAHAGRLKSFRVSHEPWQQLSAKPAILDDSLLRAHFRWFSEARVAGGNYSPGARDVLMSRPWQVPCPQIRAIECPLSCE